jgi:hypothetical protein
MHSKKDRTVLAQTSLHGSRVRSGPTPPDVSHRVAAAGMIVAENPREPRIGFTKINLVFHLKHCHEQEWQGCDQISDRIAG